MTEFAEQAKRLQKPSRTQRLKAKAETVKYRAGHERAEKAKVRRRDKGCRFPLCGCRKLGLTIKARQEVAHNVGSGKGMGGNPIGDRSMADVMVQLCGQRHIDGVVAFHKGTLRTRFLTAAKYDGHVAWYLDADVAYRRFGNLGIVAVPPAKIVTWDDGWRGVCLATETSTGAVAMFTPWQRVVLEQLAEMDL